MAAARGRRRATVAGSGTAEAVNSPWMAPAIRSIRRTPPESVDPTVKSFSRLDFSRALMEAYEISTAVNRVANDTVAVLEPASEQPAASVPEPPTTPPVKRQRQPKKDDRQTSLF